MTRDSIKVGDKLYVEESDTSYLMDLEEIESNYDGDNDGDIVYELTVTAKKKVVVPEKIAFVTIAPKKGHK